ncbi:MAG: LamG domain-containing protein [Candidatus Poribacteria bacterium]
MKITFILSLVLVFTLYATVTYGLDESLVLALAFDENQGNESKDFSKYGFKATIEGPKWGVGKFGKALEFDGLDDFVKVADAPQLRLINGGTVMAWAYILSGGHASWPRLIHKSNTTAGTGPGYEVLFDRANGDAVRVCLGSACVDSFVEMKLDREKWYHIAMTFDGAKIKVYVDANLVAERNQPGVLIDSTDIPIIIGNSFNAQRAFQGTIDEVRIWSRALKAYEIKAQMDVGIQGVISSIDPKSKITTTWAYLKS